MWPKVSASLTKKQFLFIQENFMQVRAFNRYIPLMEHRNNGIYFIGTMKQRLHLRGTGEQMQYWGTGNLIIQLRFEVTGEQVKFQGNKGKVTNAHSIYYGIYHCIGKMRFLSVISGYF